MIYDTLIGQYLDEYRLEELLGQGGMARVYRAVDVRLKRRVAIKVIDKPFRADPDYTRRFEHEARAIARLEHPHIVRLYRYGESSGLLYMVLQYVEGLGLDQLLATYEQDGERIEPAEASRIIREVGAALDYAHGQGVIHRDVKPSNVILNRDGSAILVDFGLALLAHARAEEEAFGTPQYIAPEQVRSPARAVPQSDLYALGVILYEMFTGRLPFDGPNPAEVARQHLTQPPPLPREFRPGLHPAVETVILKTLAKAPEARYPSGLALANTLDRALQIAVARGSAPPPTLAHLAIPQRVAESLADEEPAALDLPPDLVDTKPAALPPDLRPPPVRVNDRTRVRPAPAPIRPPAAPPPPGRRRWQVYLALFLAPLLLAGLILGVMWFRPDRLAGPVPVEPPPVNTPPPVNMPPPDDARLLADSQQNFSSSQEGEWAYLWSEPDENDFERMEFAERSYGACWYPEELGEDYVRICRGSGHPGEEADIAWRWTSNASGHVRVAGSARKLDAGGDGVTIIAYHNGTAVEGLRLDPEDITGVTGRNWFEIDVNEGDRLTFVMKKNERVEYDHTAFQVQIYLEP